MTGHLAQIWRHPIKGHGREPLARVALAVGKALPFDRHWGVALEAARLDGDWAACSNFARGAKAQALMAMTAALDEPTRTITLTHPDIGSLTFRPDDTADQARFLAWAAPLAPSDRAKPARIVSMAQPLTDSAYPSVSILSLSSLAALSAAMGLDLSVHRWRANLWLDGAEPWAEAGWIGRTLRIGGAELEVREQITRCRATMADPETGRVDGDTLAALKTHFGHQEMGVYAVVTKAGPVAVGDTWVLA